MKKVRKAVIAVAGFGTRFLPASKAAAKEMFPVIDKPIVQYVVEEAVASGITEIIFVTNPYKKSVEDHFNPNFELESLLERTGKTKELEEVRRISSMANFIFVRQKRMGGTGDAVLSAEAAVGDEPFLYLWGDEFIISDPPRSKQMIEAYEKYGGPIISAIETTDPAYGARFGFTEGEEVEEGVMRVRKLVEKPGFGKAPSDYGCLSSLLTPEIFPVLRKVKAEYGDKKEMFYNSDGLIHLLDKIPIHAIKIKNARYFDTGSKLNYLESLVTLGLENQEFGSEFREFLKGKV